MLLALQRVLFLGPWVLSLDTAGTNPTDIGPDTASSAENSPDREITAAKV